MTLQKDRNSEAVVRESRRGREPARRKADFRHACRLGSVVLVQQVSQRGRQIIPHTPHVQDALAVQWRPPQQKPRGAQEEDHVP